MSRLSSELARKGVHIGIGACAFLLRWLTPMQAMAVAAAACVFNLFLLHRLTGRRLLREGEREGGFSPGIAIYPAAVLVLLLVFHSRLELAAATWALLAFGDGMATVAGVLIGGPRLPWNREKTWAGFLAFVVWGTASAAWVVRWTQEAVLDAARAGTGGAHDWIGNSFLVSVGDSVTRNDPAFLIVGCAVAAFAAGWAESLDTGIDDNILVPAVGGSVLYAATLVEPARLAEGLEVLVPAAAIGAAINAVLAMAAYRARSVDRSGAFWGWVLGTALYAFGGWQGFLMLVTFFVLGTATTKLGYAKKARLGIAQEKGGRRGARNAFANTTTGVVFAFLAASTSDAAMFLVGTAAAFATAACDTVSSEVGQAYGRRHFLITSFRRVPAGTDGAVSVEGTVAGIVGAAVVALVALGVKLVDPTGALIVVVAAFAGATFESYLGATVERLGHRRTRAVRQRRGSSESPELAAYPRPRPKPRE